MMCDLFEEGPVKDKAHPLFADGRGDQPFGRGPTGLSDLPDRNSHSESPRTGMKPLSLYSNNQLE